MGQVAFRCRLKLVQMLRVQGVQSTLRVVLESRRAAMSMQKLQMLELLAYQVVSKSSLESVGSHLGVSLVALAIVMWQVVKLT